MTPARWMTVSTPRRASLTPSPDNEIAIGGFRGGGKSARFCGAADERQRTDLPDADEFLDQMAPDEAAAARDQDHYCCALRKAISPK